ncbi:hypothetical protein KIPB_002269 [Kipferlia bialata]|uniref:Uncharacterized protein n=1 Tax=Kipferlia bialata TaxID=797122 RepID=A0A391NSF2_9EUKA|nr:hypothetical protein KIPB_002269 [Kipferlia bialata]|eukprot:g2269.t1
MVRSEEAYSAVKAHLYEEYGSLFALDSRAVPDNSAVPHLVVHPIKGQGWNAVSVIVTVHGPDSEEVGTTGDGGREKKEYFVKLWSPDSRERPKQLKEAYTIYQSLSQHLSHGTEGHDVHGGVPMVLLPTLFCSDRGECVTTIHVRSTQEAAQPRDECSPSFDQYSVCVFQSVSGAMPVSPDQWEGSETEVDIQRGVARLLRDMRLLCQTCLSDTPVLPYIQQWRQEMGEIALGLEGIPPGTFSVNAHRVASSIMHLLETVYGSDSEESYTCKECTYSHRDLSYWNLIWGTPSTESEIMPDKSDRQEPSLYLTDFDRLCVAPPELDLVFLSAYTPTTPCDMGSRRLSVLGDSGLDSTDAPLRPGIYAYRLCCLWRHGEDLLDIYRRMAKGGIESQGSSSLKEVANEYIVPAIEAVLDTEEVV